MSAFAGTLVESEQDFLRYRCYQRDGDRVVLCHHEVFGGFSPPAYLR